MAPFEASRFSSGYDLVIYEMFGILEQKKYCLINLTDNEIENALYELKSHLLKNMSFFTLDFYDGDVPANVIFVRGAYAAYDAIVKILKISYNIH